MYDYNFFPFNYEGGGITYHGHHFPGYNHPIGDSDGKHKKVVLAKVGDKVKMVHFGAKGYSNNYSAQAREAYKKRHAGEGSQSKLTAGYWAYHNLWSSHSPANHAGKHSTHGERFAQFGGPMYDDGGSTYSGGLWYQDGGDVDEAQYGGIQLRDVEYPGYAGNIMDILPYLAKAKHGGIHINPAKKGTFTAAASKHGMGVQEFASQVLANKDNYSPAMVKKANFARNASKWKHQDGGHVLPAFQFAGATPGTEISLPQGPNPFEWSSFNEQPSTIGTNYGSAGDDSMGQMFAAENPAESPSASGQPLASGIGPDYNYDDIDKQYQNDLGFAMKYDKSLYDYHKANPNADSKKYMSWFNKKYPQPKQSFGQKMGQFSDALTPAINLASGIADFFVQNSRNKQQRLNGYMKGMTDQLWYNKPADLSGNRGDYVATGSMFGELRPDERVVNKGMYTGKFYPQRQFASGGVIDDEAILPVGLMETPMMGAVAVPPPVEGNSASPKMTLNADFKDYASKANAYLQRVKPDTDLTGEMLASAAQKAMEKYGTTVPVEMALAQAQLEGYLANGPRPNRPQRTKNPFNVGNTDDGSNVVHKSLESGVQSYYDLMARNYLSKRTPDDLLQNFVNSNGNRYASDKTYESKLKSIITGIQQTINAKHKYQKGGEHMDQDAVYDLTEDQIRSIIAAGGDVEFV